MFYVPKHIHTPVLYKHIIPVLNTGVANLFFYFYFSTISLSLDIPLIGPFEISPVTQCSES